MQELCIFEISPSSSETSDEIGPPLRQMRIVFVVEFVFAESKNDAQPGDLESFSRCAARQQDQGFFNDVGHCDRERLYCAGRHDFALWKKLHRCAS